MIWLRAVVAGFCSTAGIGPDFHRRSLSPIRGRGSFPYAIKSRRLVAGFGALRPAGVLFDILFGRFFEHRSHLVPHGLDPVGNLDPFGPIPLLHVRRGVAVMIGAVHTLTGRRKTREAELLPPCFADVERLKAPADILAGHDLLARQLLGVADRFRYEHRVVDPAVVEIFRELVLLDLAFALVDDMLLDVLEG